MTVIIIPIAKIIPNTIPTMAPVDNFFFVLL